MAMGVNSFANLPSLLKTRFDWGLHDVVGTINFPLSDHLRHWLGFSADGFDLPMRTTFIVINALCVVASAAAAGVPYRAGALPNPCLAVRTAGW